MIGEVRLVEWRLGGPTRHRAFNGEGGASTCGGAHDAHHATYEHVVLLHLGGVFIGDAGDATLFGVGPCPRGGLRVCGFGPCAASGLRDSGLFDASPFGYG